MRKFEKFEKIVKRDGTVVDFDASKIIEAIFKAGQATGEFGRDIAEKLTIRVLILAEELLPGIPSVEQIQDIVEQVLFHSVFWKTARAYAIYREQHRKQREFAQKLHAGLINGYLGRGNWKVAENANMTFSLQGLNHFIASELISEFWLEQIYPPEIREAHKSGAFHIHDLDILGAYCVGWDLYDLLLRGFTGVPGKVSSKPAKHFRAALGQVVNFFYTLQGEAAGAQAFSNFDTLLAPFIFYDNLSYEEVKQALQEFMFNINVPTRVGFQTPFTNITLDLVVPKHLADQAVIIGGEPQDRTYGEFQKEVDVFNKALLEIYFEGDASGRVFTFPIPTYNITPEFDWDNPNLKLLWGITAKYGVPYFANFINSDMKPEDARSMCCRLRIDNRKLEKRGGGLFGSSPLTGSIGVITINLPQIAYLSRTRSKKEFKERLLLAMELAKKSLELKRKIIEKYTEDGLYPYSKFYLRAVKERFGKYWANHFSTIGIIGMNEACLNLLGVDIASEKGRKFAEEILRFMRRQLVKFQKETGSLYNLEATPAEGASYRLARIDKEQFPDIITANPDGEPFYTNSTHLPVGHTDDIFELLDHQDGLQVLYTGGTVVHIFMGEKISPKGAKNLIRMICQKYRLPYITITPTFSICPQCGYFAGEHKECPKCGSSCEVYSRVVGYIRPVNQWNPGKQTEFSLRETYEGAVK